MTRTKWPASVQRTLTCASSMTILRAACYCGSSMPVFARWANLGPSSKAGASSWVANCRLIRQVAIYRSLIWKAGCTSSKVRAKCAANAANDRCRALKFAWSLGAARRLTAPTRRYYGEDNHGRVQETAAHDYGRKSWLLGRLQTR